jgi:molybdopterin synthase catalytic subunit
MHLHIAFSHAPIVIPAVGFLSHEIGAIAEFQGVVRAQEGSQILQGLHYEAYLPMADKELRRIFEELHRAYPCDSVEFIHRLGWVPVAETSLWIRVQSRHRAQAFSLLAESITRMKAVVPIWKTAPAP